MVERNRKGRQWSPLFSDRLWPYIERQEEWKEAVVCLMRENGDIDVVSTMNSQKVAIKMVKETLRILTTEV